MSKENPFRRFELTISVWIPKDAELPETFGDWVYAAFGIRVEHASPTQLERVVEARHPPAKDIVERREGERKRKHSRSLYQ
jgi:hypothetical protein